MDSSPKIAKKPIDLNVLNTSLLIFRCSILLFRCSAALLFLHSIKNPAKSGAYKILQDFLSRLRRGLLLSTARNNRCLLLRCTRTSTRTGCFSASSTWDEESRKEAKQCNHYCQHPGTFFQHICGLLDTHKLGIEPSDISCKPSAFRVLNEDEKTNRNRSKDQQDQKQQYHINSLLIVQFWLQSNGFCQDWTNLISHKFGWLC